MNQVFVVGIFKEKTSKGTAWEVAGVYDKRNKAEIACLSNDYFVGPLPLNTIISTDGEEWPGAYYPRCKK